MKLEVVYKHLTCHIFWKGVLTTINCILFAEIYQKRHRVWGRRKGKIIKFSRKQIETSKRMQTMSKGKKQSTEAKSQAKHGDVTNTVHNEGLP